MQHLEFNIASTVQTAILCFVSPGYNLLNNSHGTIRKHNYPHMPAGPSAQATVGSPRSTLVADPTGLHSPSETALQHWVFRGVSLVSFKYPESSGFITGLPKYA